MRLLKEQKRGQVEQAAPSEYWERKEMKILGENKFRVEQNWVKIVEKAVRDLGENRGQKSRSVNRASLFKLKKEISIDLSGSDLFKDSE